ncbi:MAG: ROK family protein, partial [Bacteroidales bacterium]|nr:ROK family protein [Bacteroidales bacterium]
NLDWDTWADQFNEYLLRVEELIWPDRIIIGGGASKKGDKFFPHLTTKAAVVPATLKNEAGIVGAAMVSKYYNKLEK